MAHSTFPSDLPVPTNDGACKHLENSTIASVTLPTTLGSSIDVATLQGLAILFCYPRTGAAGETIPDEWNSIPGARGCTPQACSFRDNLPALQKYNVKHIYGISTQDTPYQQEVKSRVHLPYDLLSDEKLELTNALKLPTFDWQGKKLIKRLTLAVLDGKIIKVWYPVFPPDQSANQVLEWLETEYKST